MNLQLDFQQQLLHEVARTLGVSYEQMAKDYQPTIVTPKMIRLLASGERRKMRRAWRIYFAANGQDAPLSALSIRAQWQRERWAIEAINEAARRGASMLNERMEALANTLNKGVSI